MKKHILLFLVFLLFYSNSKSQDLNLSWINTLNGGNSQSIVDEDNLDMMVLNDGNLLITGFYTDTIDFDPGSDTLQFVSQNAQRDLFMMKLDSLGGLVWVKTLEGNSTEYGYGLATDPSGNIYLTGMFWETVDFDPGPGVENRTALANERDAFVLKLDENGGFIWVDIIAGTGIDSGADLFIDEAGDIYVLGNYSNTADLDPGEGVFTLTTENNRNNFLLKLDTDGNFIWAKNVTEGGGVFFYGMTHDSNYNIILGGFSNDSIDMDAGPEEDIMVAENSDICILKMDANGEYLWAKVFGGSDLEECKAIICDSNDDIIISGYYRGVSDFDPGPDTYNLPAVPNSYEVFVAKFNGSGDLVWADPVYGANSEFCNTVDLDANDNIYIAGLFVLTTDFDPGEDTYIVNAINGDFYILKLSPAGDFIWAETYGGDGLDEGKLIAVDEENIYISGLYAIPFEIDGDDSSFVETKGNYDLFTIKFIQCTEVDEAPVPEVENLPELTFTCSIDNVPIPIALNSCGDLIAAVTETEFPIVSPGSTLITWTYTNSYGTQATQDQLLILLEDTEAPVPDNPELEDVVAQCMVEELSLPLVSDNCTIVDISHDAALPITNQGETIVTWTYTDESGNSSTQTQTVVVEDTEGPVPDQESLNDLTGACSIEVSNLPTATDNCSGQTAAGISDVGFPITDVGLTVITWSFEDDNGNVTTQIQNATITPIDNTVDQNQNTLTANAVGYGYQWIDCSNGNQPIEGETGQGFEAVSDGSYAVIISDGECSVVSECINVSVTSIEERSLADLSIYPNPADDFIVVESSAGEEIALEIVDVNGKVVKRMKFRDRQYEISISDLTPGNYILKATRNNGVKHIRFVKL